MPLTTLTFPFRLHPGHLPNFRAAIVEQVGLGHRLFHGHDNSEPGRTKYSNEYPLIRFGLYRGRAQIGGIGAGADALIRHLLPVLPNTLTVAGQTYDTTGYTLRTHRWEPTILSERQPFGLFRWIALNKANYLDWKKLEHNEPARRVLLDKCLTGHLRALAEAVGFGKEDRQRISGAVLRQDGVKRIRWHGNHFVAFNAVAEGNFPPPPGWGLGRCLSFGFGEVCTESNYRALATRRVKKRHPSSSVPVDTAPATAP